MLEMDPIKRLTRDLKKKAATVSRDEARFLVDGYYMMQKNRIRSGNQVEALKKAKEPNETLEWFEEQSATLERDIKKALSEFAEAHVVGQWAKSIMGIGTVLAAGLLAHIDITKAPTVGHIWRFAGLDPTVEWEKSEKRPWNAALKTLTWKIGESFVKVSGHEDDVYGHLYLERKEYEHVKNAAGQYAEQAAAKLVKFKIGKGTEAFKKYSAGQLPDGHIHARAKRWTVKLFLAHWHAVAYRDHYKKRAPKPFILTQPNHVHEIVCPNWPWA